MRPIFVAVLALEGMNMQCGPTDQEAGLTILLIAPVIALTAMGLQWLLLRVWQRARPIELAWRKNLFLVGALSCGSLISLLVSARPFRWADIALWLFGNSWLAVLLVVTRLFLFRARPGPVFFAPHAICAGLFLPPAILLATDHFHAIGDASQMLWIMPGYYGWVSGPLLVLLFVEALIRRRRALAIT